MSSLNVNQEFNTEMEQLTPETRAHADRFNERYGQLLGNDAFLKGKLEDANTNIERAMAVAQGKSAGYVFNTYSELIAYIAVPANAEKFRLGDQFLIKATDVPDYWWDNTVTTAQTDSAGNVISGKNTSGKIIGALVELEARKIDLSKYDANDVALFNNMSDQYSSARTYDVGDICIHNNDLYKCVTAVEAAETFNASKWNKTSLAALHAEQEKKISENTRSLTQIKTYVGKDGNLHFINSAGADTVIPFNSGYKEVAIVFADYQRVAACILIKPNKSVIYGWDSLQGDYMALHASGNGNCSIITKKAGKYLVFDTQATVPKTSTTQVDASANTTIVMSTATTQFSINVAVAL